MTQRDKPWQIAADLEKAAIALRAACDAIVNVDEDAWSEINKIEGVEHVSITVALALQALSDRYQDIADAEVG